MSSSLAQDRNFFRTGNYFSFFFFLHSSEVVTFNFQKTQYCVTLSISYSRVGSQEPLIINCVTVENFTLRTKGHWKKEVTEGERDASVRDIRART